jgi:hypothetical protein
MSEWLTGNDLLKKWIKRDFELFEYVQKGLQPYRYGKPLPPPDVKLKRDELKLKKKELQDFIKNSRLELLYYMYPQGQEQWEPELKDAGGGHYQDRAGGTYTLKKN